MKSDSEISYLLEEARKLRESEMDEKLADETLDSNKNNIQDVKKMVEIALLCKQSPPSSRPTMSEILAMILSDGLENMGSFFKTSILHPMSTQSYATTSITQFSGR